MHRRLGRVSGSSGRRRNKNVLVAEGVLEAVQGLRDEGTEPTFGALMANLRSKGVLSNHGSLRQYLDPLTESGLLSVRTETASKPNVRPKQVYSVSDRGPLVEAGEKALLFHGLNWTIPAKSSRKLRTDLEGVVRARLEGGTLYASLEDAVVEALAAVGRDIPYCAALLATKRFDAAYLMRRARERGVGESAQELLDEIEYLFSSPKPELEDLKSLYAIRRWAKSAHRRSSPRSRDPRWSLLSMDELVDVLGKQLGVK